MADIDEEKVTEKSAKHIVARDGDPNWFNNPQFVRTRAEIPPLPHAVPLWCRVCVRVWDTRVPLTAVLLLFFCCC